MPASEVMTKILEDFTANQPELETAQLKAFCEYAATWFVHRGVIGVGHTPAGLALRFADGTERLLFEAPAHNLVGASREVNITGTYNKITKPIVGDSAAVQITGR